MPLRLVVLLAVMTTIIFGLNQAVITCVLSSLCNLPLGQMPPSLLKLHHRSYPSLLIVWFTILCQGKTANISINHILGFVQIQFPRLIW